MRFAFTADQLELRAGLRDMLADVSLSDVVRSTWESAAPGPVPTLWRRLGEIGFLGLLAPIEAGGMGCTEIELVLLAEECGRFALPGPIAEHVAIAVPAFVGAAVPEADVVLSGERVASVLEPGVNRLRWIDHSDLTLRVSSDAVELVDRGKLKRLAESPSVDQSISCARVDMPAGVRLGGVGAGLAIHRATVTTAAQLVGLADAMIAMATKYVGMRTQFGKLVGAQQSVKHLLATALVALEHARPVVYRAGWSLAHGAEESETHVSFAKIYAGRAATLAARTALQCHGAIGYSWEHDLHLWMKRVWALDAAWGTRQHHEDILAHAILG